MVFVGFQLSDRTYGLSAEQAQFLAGMLRRRLTVPKPVEDLADEIWAQSMANPDAGDISRDIVLTTEQMRELHDTMTKVRPADGDTTAWDELTNALARELAH